MTGPSATCLVTGATGFVGGELLVRLLERTERPVICPVRADSDIGARTRGRDRLVDLLGAEAAAHFGGRVDWIRSDISEPRLGWATSTWDSVAARVTEIFHCAASVSFDLPLDEADRINVGGTRHVFELAQAAHRAHGSFDRFHHVSTAYVSGKTRGRVTAAHVPTDRARNFRNTYEQTKARAERFLRRNASDDVPISIHRPSIIAGHTTTGRTTNWNVMYVPMKMVARGALPVFARSGRELVDAVAVDYLVDAMLVYSEIDTAKLEAHHLTAGPTAVTVTDVIGGASSGAKLRGDYKPSDTKLVGPVQWHLLMAALKLAARLPKQVGKLRRQARLALRCVDGCGVYLPYAKVNTIFDADHEHATLAEHGVVMPPGPEYLATITRYALRTNFGKIPASQATDISDSLGHAVEEAA